MSIWGLHCFLGWITCGERIFQNEQILWSEWTAYNYGPAAPTLLYRDYPGVTVKLSAYKFCWGEMHLQLKFLQSLDPGSSIGALTFSQTIPNSQVNYEKELSQGKELVIWGRLGFQMFFFIISLKAHEIDFWMEIEIDMMIWWNPRCFTQLSSYRSTPPRIFSTKWRFRGLGLGFPLEKMFQKSRWWRGIRILGGCFPQQKPQGVRWNWNGRDQSSARNMVIYEIFGTY